MRILFLFLDGIGLGENDPEINPFARASMPILKELLGGQRLTKDVIDSKDPVETGRATLLALDAGLSVPGRPQSATGQAVLFTGNNVPAELGYHYGPKPNQEVAETLRNGNLFSRLREKGYRAALLNAYPPGYFSGIQSGRRLFSSIPLAVTSAGIALMTVEDLHAGRALSADFTGQGWRDRFGLEDNLVLTPERAGARLAELSADYDLSVFEYWLSDIAGHKQDMVAACRLLEDFDRILGGLLAAWDDREGLILITSDHGNLEDISTRRHTENPVPCLLIGTQATRESFSTQLVDLTGIAPAILRVIEAGI
jgi:2,3-bisphosphoglycerate-independent phosphoglycerate mutase